MLDSEQTEPPAHGVGDQEGEPRAPDRSLTDDLAALFEDGQTYFQAELGYQKTRLAFMADRGKRGALLILGALVFLNSAVIALIVGLLLTLAPLIGPLGATAVVVAILVAAAIALALMARKRFRAIRLAYDEERP